MVFISVMFSFFSFFLHLFFLFPLNFPPLYDFAFCVHALFLEHICNEWIIYRQSVCMFERGWATPLLYIWFYPAGLNSHWVRPNATVKVADPETTRALPHKQVQVCPCAFIRTQFSETSQEMRNQAESWSSTFTSTITIHSWRVQFEMTSFQQILQFWFRAASFAKWHSYHSQLIPRWRRGKVSFQKVDTSSGSWLWNNAWEVNHWNEGRLVGDWWRGCWGGKWWD